MNQVIKSHIHTETTHESKLIATSLEMLIDYEETLTKAIDIVDAQFYYTNPLMFAILDADADVSKHARLWGNYYLLDVETWDTVALIDDIFAVNQTFDEIIGVGDLSELDDLNALHALHAQHGMYIIGIRD